MSATQSKCYRNREGFRDDTDFVEVLSDGTSIVHTVRGAQNPFAHDFNGPISRGEWIEIVDPRQTPLAIGGAP